MCGPEPCNLGAAAVTFREIALTAYMKVGGYTSLDEFTEEDIVYEETIGWDFEE